MVPDRQKVWTDGWTEWNDGRTHRRRQNYIPPTSSGDNKQELLSQLCYTLLHVQAEHATIETLDEPGNVKR